MNDYHPRNWQGYAGQIPDYQWPDQQRIAINLVINYEEGAERNVLDGDSESENLFSGFPCLKSFRGERHFSSESLFAYGARAGCLRLLKILDEFDIPATLFACGQALERNPALTEKLKHSSHELAGHGYRWIDYRYMSSEEENIDIRQCIQTIHRLTGKPVTGWYTGRTSPNTRKLLIDANLLYDSDDYSDDLPFWISIDSREHLIIPYTLINNDIQYCLPAGWNSPETAFQHLKATFDALYREGTKGPTLMSIGLHSRLSGHPGRSEAIRLFIRYALSHDHIWFTTRADIANYLLRLNA